MYARTNKNRRYGLQIAKGIRRTNMLVKMAKGIDALKRTHRDVAEPGPAVQRAGAQSRRKGRILAASERLPPGNARDRYQISEDKRTPVDIPQFLNDHADDPACKVWTFCEDNH